MILNWAFTLANLFYNSETIDVYQVKKISSGFDI